MLSRTVLIVDMVEETWRPLSLRRGSPLLAASTKVGLVCEFEIEAQENRRGWPDTKTSRFAIGRVGGLVGSPCKTGVHGRKYEERKDAQVRDRRISIYLFFEC